MKQALKIAVPMVLAAMALSCGGNSSLDNREATVFLTVSIDNYTPDVDICLTAGIDVDIDSMTIQSNPVDPNATVTANQDVTLTRWAVTPYRTDGGTVVSPEWVNDVVVHVPAGGSADLSNYRVFPAEYFDDLPLSNLYPQNGGIDPETGNANIRQSLSVQLFGRTVSGKQIATEQFPVAFNFTCGSTP